MNSCECRGRESNPHSLRNIILSDARLPISPPRRIPTITYGRPERDSNPRVSILQIDVLPLHHRASFGNIPRLASCEIIDPLAIFFAVVYLEIDRGDAWKACFFRQKVAEFAARALCEIERRSLRGFGQHRKKDRN